MRIIEALLESARRGRPVKIDPISPERRPEPSQEISHSPVKEPRLVHAESPIEGR